MRCAPDLRKQPLALLVVEVGARRLDLIPRDLDALALVKRCARARVAGGASRRAGGVAGARRLARGARGACPGLLLALRGAAASHAPRPRAGPCARSPL